MRGMCTSTDDMYNVRVSIHRSDGVTVADGLSPAGRRDDATHV